MVDIKHSSRLKPWLGFAIVMAIGLVLYWAFSGYGRVGQPAYELASAAYATILTRDKARLETLEKLLENPTSDSHRPEITPRERKWLQQIISDARRGNWDRARTQARRLLDAQAIAAPSFLD